MDVGFLLELVGLGLSAFDPIGVAIVILLLAQPHGTSRAWSFLAGSAASLMFLGMLVASGFGRPIVRFREQFPWLDPGFEAVAGAVLVVVGFVLLRHARGAGTDQGIQPEFITRRLRVSTPILFVLGFLLVSVQNALDAVFIVAMVDTGTRLLSTAHTLLAVSVYTLAAVLVQVVLIVAYQLLPDERRRSALDGFNRLLERRGEQVAGWLSLGLGTLLVVFGVSDLLRL